MSTGPQRVAGTALVGWATPLRFHSLQDDFTILGSKPQSLSPRRALLGAKTPMPWRIPNLLTLPVPRAEIPPVCACFKCSIAIRPAALPYPFFEIRVGMIRSPAAGG